MDDSLKIGTILHGKSYEYKIISSLGQGSFGITYLASVKMTGALGSIDSEILVAVKEFFMRKVNGRSGSSVTCSSKDGLFAYYKTKFEHEAQNLSKLHDPRIIKVIELFEENQTVYYVMEYVSQGSLDSHIKSRGQLTPAECVAYATQIARALGYMHKNNMLHLDLKPNNIMLKGDNDIVLIDFGLSKRFDANGQPETSTSIGHGTPGYAPVEQANYQRKNGDELPAVMDIYALGATMYKMLTGERPPEASVILNDGFPYADLRRYGVPQAIEEVVAKCMEPMRKHRYKSAEEVISALNSIDVSYTGKSPKGHYKRKHGEREYGTFYIEKVPVTSCIDFPEYVDIRLWDNSKKGKSYEVIMTDGHFEDGYYSLLKVWDGGKLIHEQQFTPGIPKDVKEFIISHGFLSTEHWEEESSTTPFADDFGTDASITMVLNDGTRFVRRVSHAHPNYHNLLLDELLDLLYSTSLVNKLDAHKTQPLVPQPFVIPVDTCEVSVNFTEPHIGPGEGGNSYVYKINENNLCAGNKGLSRRKFQSFLKAIANLGILVGPYRDGTLDYSEVPGTLNMEFKSRDNTRTRIYLMAFNTDRLAGNIYGADINELAESIKRIFLRYQTYNHEPTRELIYSIPDATYSVGIEYSEGGAVGLTPPPVNIEIVNEKRRNHDNDYIVYSPEEFSALVNGLRQLRLRSQEEKDVEPSTGEKFPRLRLTLYDRDHKLLKSIYAEDRGYDGYDMIGNAAISVDDLKTELTMLSKSFKHKVTITDSKQEQPQREPVGDTILKVIILSFIIAVVALPTYIFVKPEDELYRWLWITIGITEILGVVPFILGGRYRKPSGVSILPTVGFFVGALGLIAYLVLWIIQMCKWWI